MVLQKTLEFNNDNNFPLKLEAIRKEINLATRVPKSNKTLRFTTPKSLNPYNALRGAVPKNRTPKLPGLMISELLTYNTARPIAQLYAKILNKDTGVAALNAFGIRDKSGNRYKKQDPYERAKQDLEWKNAALYYEWMLQKADPYGVREFVPDTLIDMPQFSEGVQLYNALKTKDSELLKAP